MKVTFSFLLDSSGSTGLIVCGCCAGLSLDGVTLLDKGIEKVADTATFVLLMVVIGLIGC